MDEELVWEDSDARDMCDNIRTPEDAVRILCLLQAEVSQTVYAFRHVADCICGQRQQWVEQGTWQNEGRSIAYIIDAVRKQLEVTHG